MIRKPCACSLLPTGDVYLAAKVVRGEESPYEVEWLDTLRGDNPAQSSHWRDLCKQPRQTQLLLPSDAVTLLQLRLPELKPDELTQALIGTIVAQKGGAPEHWIIDHQRRPRDPGDGERPAPVAALCLERATLPPLLAPLVALEFRPARALPGAVALHDLLRGEIAEREEQPAGLWNLVHVGREERFLVIGDASGPRLLRKLPQDLSEGGEREEYVDRLFTEVERSSFFARQGDTGGTVSHVFVAGDPALADPLQARLAASDGPACERWRPEELFAVEGAAASWEFLLPLAGAASLLGGPLFNLMPRRRSGARARTTRRYLAYGGVAACLALLPLLGVGGFSTRRVQEDVLRRQDRQLNESRRVAEDVARAYVRNLKLLDRRNTLNQRGRPNRDIAPMLRDLARRLPDAVHLEDLELLRAEDGAYALTLHGECRGRTAELAQSRFLDLHAALDGSPYLLGARDPVTIEISSRTQHADESLVRFVLEYSLRGGVDG